MQWNPFSQQARYKIIDDIGSNVCFVQSVDDLLLLELGCPVYPVLPNRVAETGK